MPALVAAVERELGNAGIEPEYVEARGADDLKPVAELNGRPVLLAVAARGRQGTAHRQRHDQPESD